MIPRSSISSNSTGKPIVSRDPSRGPDASSPRAMISPFFRLSALAVAILLQSPATVPAAEPLPFPALDPDGPASVTLVETEEVVRPDYVRLTSDDQSNRLEVKIGKLELPDGRKVHLVGVVHLGDKSYYEEIDRRLAQYDSVLFELVGDPRTLQGQAPVETGPAPRAHPLRSLQETVGRTFQLSFQLEHIDYKRPTFVHADTTAAEFSRMQAERGESMMKLLLKSFQMSADPAMKAKLQEASKLSIVDLVTLFYSPKAMQRIKLVFARFLAESETFLESGMEKNNAIINGRNEVALRKLREVLQDPAKKQVAVFYGAGHMASMEESLVRDWGATHDGDSWLTAWTMPPTPPKKSPESSPKPAKPAAGPADHPDR